MIHLVGKEGKFFFHSRHRENSRHKITRNLTQDLVPEDGQFKPGECFSLNEELFLKNDPLSGFRWSTLLLRRR